MSEEEAEDEDGELEGLEAEAEDGGTSCNRCGAEESEVWATSRRTGKLPPGKDRCKATPYAAV